MILKNIRESSLSTRREESCRVFDLKSFSFHRPASLLPPLLMDMCEEGKR